MATKKKAAKPAKKATPVKKIAPAKKAAAKVEKTYGKKNLGPWSKFDWGMLNGKLSALRWCLGGLALAEGMSGSVAEAIAAVLSV